MDPISAIFLKCIHLHLHLQIDGAYSRSIERHFLSHHDQIFEHPVNIICNHEKEEKV